VHSIHLVSMCVFVLRGALKHPMSCRALSIRVVSLLELHFLALNFDAVLLFDANLIVLLHMRSGTPTLGECL